MFARSRTHLGLSPIGRLSLLLASGLVFGLLGTAARLTPSPEGVGTHQQLGLPPCTIQQLWGTRCPACGMTTSWSHVARGDLIAALRCQVTGTWLAIVGGITGVFACAAAVRGEWVGWRPSETWVLIGCVGTMVAVVVEWSIRAAWENTLWWS